jgi:hypothetical protein
LPITDKEIEKAFDLLPKKIGANMDADALWWTTVRQEYSHLQDFIQAHCNTSRYCLEIKKCKDNSWKACQWVSIICF